MRLRGPRGCSRCGHAAEPTRAALPPLRKQGPRAQTLTACFLKPRARPETHERQTPVAAVSVRICSPAGARRARPCRSLQRPGAHTLHRGPAARPPASLSRPPALPSDPRSPRGHPPPRRASLLSQERCGRLTASGPLCPAGWGPRAPGTSSASSGSPQALQRAAGPPNTGSRERLGRGPAF